MQSLVTENGEQGAMPTRSTEYLHMGVAFHEKGRGVPDVCCPSQAPMLDLNTKACSQRSCARRNATNLGAYSCYQHISSARNAKSWLHRCACLLPSRARQPR
jgi:hypothetical protein